MLLSSAVLLRELPSTPVPWFPLVAVVLVAPAGRKLDAAVAQMTGGLLAKIGAAPAPQLAHCLALSARLQPFGFYRKCLCPRERLFLAVEQTLLPTQARPQTCTPCKPYSKTSFWGLNASPSTRIESKVRAKLPDARAGGHLGERPAAGLGGGIRGGANICADALLDACGPAWARLGWALLLASSLSSSSILASLVICEHGRAS